MEDAHIAAVGLGGDHSCSIFGVFDGHGGAEVAKFCQRYMADEINKLPEMTGGMVEDALIAAFHRMDEMLRDHSYAEELEQLKTKEVDEEEESKGEEGDSVTAMDALEMIKRVFQLKRFMGENGQPEEGGPSTGEANAMEADEAPAEIEPAITRVQAGCTAVVAVKKGNELFVANAGDSRGVLCRGGQAIALSEDHKPAQEGERNRILNAGKWQQLLFVHHHNLDWVDPGHHAAESAYRLGLHAMMWQHHCTQYVAAAEQVPVGTMSMVSRSGTSDLHKQSANFDMIAMFLLHEQALCESIWEGALHAFRRCSLSSSCV
jgi:serine/threonine protein phosphatase PrpC